MQIPQGLSSCVNKALYRLSLGDMTVQEMMEYLTSPHRKNTGFSSEEAQRTAELLLAEGFLDDKRYLKVLLRRLEEKGFGPRRIRQELVRHGFSAALIQRVEERRVDYTARALRYLVQTKKAPPKTAQERKKLMDSLVRRGYDYTTAAEAVRQITEEDFTFSD